MANVSTIADRKSQITNYAPSKMKHLLTISINLENFRFWNQINPKEI